MTLLQVVGAEDIQTLLILLVVGLILFFVIKYNKRIDTVSNHDQQPFEGMQFSTQEFYSLIEAQIKEKQMPDVRMGRVYHAMHGMLSGKREYLRVQYQNFFFDICAAPFAKDFFVSYRQGMLNVLIKSKRRKTFYEQDSEAMFHGAVLLCYQRAIDQMKETKGNRKNADELSLLQ